MKSSNDGMLYTERDFMELIEKYEEIIIAAGENGQNSLYLNERIEEIF